MDWITPQIAIGNFMDARASASRVDAILCLREGCCDDRPDMDIYSIPLIDGSGNSKQDVLEAIALISGVVSSGERILVHCHAGKSRSVCIVAAYLMKHEGFTKRQALTLIESKREIYLSNGIEEIFKHIAER